ncbi:MAG: outer membrane beta-barrel protein [Candidatus Omnitrophota bacterium]|nr:outer membrane beta-barrel protein [Candidatus Omnitrophota bacterium]
MKKRIVLGSGLIVFLFFSNVLNAQEDKEIKYPTLAPEARELKPAYEAGEGEFNFSLSISEGYDNNVKLDSLRREDTFSEQDLSLSYQRPFTDIITFFIEDDLSNITYYEFSDESLISNDLKAGLDMEFSDRLKARIGYDFEVLRYYQLGEGDYWSNIPLVNLKYYITKDFYGIIGYKYIDRSFIKRRIRNNAFVLLDKKRKDSRHVSICEIGYLFSQTLLKLKNEYYRNNSNDQYFNYYDYWADTVTLSVIHMFNDKLYGFLSFGRQWRQYNDRLTRLPLATFPVQEDKLLLGYACLNYDITEDMSLNIDYAYRENDSNDPDCKYSGSIISGGLNVAF